VSSSALATGTRATFEKSLQERITHHDPEEELPCPFPSAPERRSAAVPEIIRLIWPRDFERHARIATAGSRIWR